MKRVISYILVLVLIFGAYFLIKEIQSEIKYWKGKFKLFEGINKGIKNDLKKSREENTKLQADLKEINLNKAKEKLERDEKETTIEGNIKIIRRLQAIQRRLQGNNKNLVKEIEGLQPIGIDLDPKYIDSLKKEIINNSDKLADATENYIKKTKIIEDLYKKEKFHLTQRIINLELREKRLAKIAMNRFEYGGYIRLDFDSINGGLFLKYKLIKIAKVPISFVIAWEPLKINYNRN